MPWHGKQLNDCCGRELDNSCSHECVLKCKEDCDACPDKCHEVCPACSNPEALSIRDRPDWNKGMNSPVYPGPPESHLDECFRTLVADNPIPPWFVLLLIFV